MSRLSADREREVVELALAEGLPAAMERFHLSRAVVKSVLARAQVAADYAWIHDVDARQLWVERTGQRRMALLDRLVDLSEQAGDAVELLLERAADPLAEGRDVAHFAGAADKLVGRIHAVIKDLSPLESQLGAPMSEQWSARELEEPGAVVEYPPQFFFGNDDHDDHNETTASDVSG